MARQNAPKPPPAPAADPLADLRESDDDAPTILPGGREVPAEPVAVELRPMVSEELHQELVAEMVAAWHQDPTSQGFLHGGGSVCGCHYIARHALRVAVPVMTEADQEERELEPSRG